MPLRANSHDVPATTLTAPSATAASTSVLLDATVTRSCVLPSSSSAFWAARTMRPLRSSSAITASSR